jgi:hypothetical protein
VLMTRFFSVSLSLLKVGILGCVERMPPFFVRLLREELAGDLLSPVFLGLMDCLV